MSIANSSNCFESTGLGALVIKHEASFTLGKVRKQVLRVVEHHT